VLVLTHTHTHTHTHINNVHAYLIVNRNKECDLLQDRPVLLTGRTPHDKQNRNYLDYSQNMVMSPRGAQCQD